MRHALGRFCNLLRAEGVRVSPAELIDAARAVSTVDVTDRERLRDVLAATLAKSQADHARFDAAFERFFAAPSFRGRRRKRRRKRARGAVPEGTGTGGRAGAPSEPSDAASVVRGACRRMLDAERRGIPRTRSPRRYPCPVVATRRETETRDRRRSLDDALAARDREGRGRRAHRVPVAARSDETRDDASRLRGTLSVVRAKPFRESWSSAEEHALGEQLERALRRMRLRRSRRRRRARHGSIWVQRVVRANLGHEGVPFTLVRHAPSRREPRLVLLVDVSHSVARAASAFLTLATHLTASLRTVRCFAFVDNVVEVTDLVPRLAKLRGETVPLDTLVRETEGLDPAALSDYGRVLYQLLHEYDRDLRHDTVLLVLGDARTNRFDPAAWVLEEIRSRVKRVIWLVPEPVREWDTGDSVVHAYAPHVDLLAESADLEGLRTGLERALPLR